jgi:glycosyltransferase involved in cell wall biosynthesis
MTSLIENQTVVTKATDKSSSVDEARPSTFSKSAFLMVNSLETGGTERQFVKITRALRARQVPLHLGCIKKEGAFIADAGDAEEFRLGGSLYGLQSIRTRWRLARHLRRQGIAVAHSFDFYTNLTMIPAARMACIPVVIGSHRQIGDLLTPTQFRVQLAAFRICDRVVCNSQAAADRLRQAGLPERKIAVIGNALSLAAFVDTAPALPRIEGILRVGMIARMNAAYKNHRGFLQAAARLKAKFPSVEFVLAGDGPLRPELERQASALGIANGVQFLGDRRDIKAILASLDVSVVPSTSESLSNVMLESMAAGVPVVANSVGGNIELGGNGRAVLIPAAEDERGLEDGIERLLQDGALRSALAIDARAFVEANFSTEQICQQYEDLFAEAFRENNEHAAF